MNCPRCKSPVAAEQRFCSECGAALARSCPSCGSAESATARFCGQCGTALIASTPILTGEGERKHVTVLFADIRDSTSTIEQLDPEDAMLRLDPTLQLMTEAVRRFGGIVNRVQGDGVMA